MSKKSNFDGKERDHRNLLLFRSIINFDARSTVNFCAPLYVGCSLGITMPLFSLRASLSRLRSRHQSLSQRFSKNKNGHFLTQRSLLSRANPGEPIRFSPIACANYSSRCVQQTIKQLRKCLGIQKLYLAKLFVRCLFALHLLEPHFLSPFLNPPKKVHSLLDSPNYYFAPSFRCSKSFFYYFSSRFAFRGRFVSSFRAFEALFGTRVF